MYIIFASKLIYLDLDWLQSITHKSNLDRNQYNLFRHNDSRLGSRTLFRFVTDLVKKTLIETNNETHPNLVTVT